MFHHVFPQTLDSLPTIFPSIVKCEINIYTYSCRNWNWLFSTVRDKILHISCRIQNRINYEFRVNEILYENGWVNCKTLNLKPCISLFSLIKICINFPFNFQLNVKKKKQKLIHIPKFSYHRSKMNLPNSSLTSYISKHVQRESSNFPNYKKKI